MATSNPKKYYSILAILLLLAFMALCWYFKVNLIVAYFISISVITIFFYGYDKNRARKNKGRVPEILLHLLALVGGSPGALLGQKVFGHKTMKWKFSVVFIFIVVVQVGGIVGRVVGFPGGWIGWFFHRLGFSVFCRSSRRFGACAFLSSRE